MSADLHPVAQVAGCEAFGCPAGRAYRGNDLTADQRCNEGQQDHQDRSGGHHRVTENDEGGDLLREREHQIDLKAIGALEVESRACNQPCYRGPTVAVVDLGRGHQQVVANTLFNLPAQCIRNMPYRVAGGDRLARRDDDHLELLGPTGETGGHVEEQLIHVDVTGEIYRVELLLRRVDGLSSLVLGGFLLAVDHSERGLLHQQETAEDQHQH